MNPVRAAASLLLCVALSASAGMYKIVGADGKISYADNPPTDTRAAKVTEVRIQSYAGPAEIGATAAKPDWAAILKRPVGGAAASGGLVMFSTPTCTHCKKAKRFMNAKGIAYSEVDISANARGKNEYLRLGGRGVPLFVLGEKTMTGFSEAALADLLGRSL